MIALARKYRPKQFADLIVQDHVAAALRGAVARYGMQRNTTRATLDANHVARDRELRAAVDAAGRQFQRSRCGHP